MMKKRFVLPVIIVSILLSACSNNNTSVEEQEISKNSIVADTCDATNNFYDNAETFDLNVEPIEIAGEVENPGIIDFSELPLRSVIVKETLLDWEGDKFIGSYRYDGYSLSDILNYIKVDKKNADSFRPIIDQYVEVENSNGEKVILSWGEIYYPNHLHEIIIATKVMRIVPSKTDELWTLPKESKLIVVSDLITERNINSPVKITVKSCEKEFDVEKGKDPMFSPQFDLFLHNEKKETYIEQPKGFKELTLHTIFYGRGRGIHSTKPFTGIKMNDLIVADIKMNKTSLQKGIIVVAADDGYRVVYSYSEICNRNDQAEVLIIYRPEEKNGGAFRLFPSCDFFSDRAVKSVTSVHYNEMK